MRLQILLIYLICIIVSSIVLVESSNKHHFKENDEVPFYVNNVGPYSNPTETYEFYTLPFCKPSSISYKKTKLGEILQGDSAVLSDYQFPFKNQEDYGWKLVHGDVFRFPPYKNVFSAFYGIGWQFISIVCGILALSLFGMFYPNNGGNMYTAGIVLYALTSGISGYQSAKMYKNMGGNKWAWNIVLTATLFVAPLFIVVILSNTVAITWHSTVALPILTMIEVITIWLFVGFPLTVVGGIAGRRLSENFEAPCRTKNFPREVPPIQWYRRLPCQILIAGFLPFSAIYIELFYIFNSVWGHSTYTLYGILCLVFLILINVTVCITVALTYFQLSMEDHKWWWNSFINGGSTVVFIYMYSIYYYYYISHMYGLLQATFYFTYMLIVCFFFFILLGTVGFYSSLIFVKRIYRNLKSD
ncbi:TM9 protein B [Dictyostelium discoideum AX4]|uniref:TM9 protein B n=1 Tax=Dictyostelium discoideum AX4 TaxID=352472 RepID=UPI00004E3C0C|nr:TM9 protein B [Dictyostelium discoideum AX4]EAL68823.1 TM9 protein B [Dictyostelium discoideum AX4]|eukprot:XP_642757.1 TM9 protein B [Dictyostelium discoideum AX4]